MSFLSFGLLSLLYFSFLIFNHFKKNQHLKSIKEFTKKLTQEAENFQLPSLEFILSQNFGVNKRTEWTCTLCDFVGKNKGSLSSHLKKHNFHQHFLGKKLALLQPGALNIFSKNGK